MLENKFISLFRPCDTCTNHGSGCNCNIITLNDSTYLTLIRIALQYFDGLDPYYRIKNDIELREKTLELLIQAHKDLKAEVLKGLGIYG
jgi:hypothetical protein